MAIQLERLREIRVDLGHTIRTDAAGEQGWSRGVFIAEAFTIGAVVGVLLGGGAHASPLSVLVLGGASLAQALLTFRS
ncbi:MAG: hypothetical protein ACJ76W_09965 [Chloroflexota bacterium]